MILHAHRQTAPGTITAPQDTSSDDKTQQPLHSSARTLGITRHNRGVYVATAAEGGRIAHGDLHVLSCLSPQHVSSAKYAQPDDKSAKTLTATQICLLTK